MSQAYHTQGISPRIVAPRTISYLLSHGPQTEALDSLLSEASDIGMPNERCDEGFLAAVRQFQGGRWQRAFTQLTSLADGGHAPAAKLALLMLRHGRTRFGMTFDAEPPRIARWARYVLGRSTSPDASDGRKTCRHR
jgi:hypothetical protein